MLVLGGRDTATNATTGNDVTNVTVQHSPNAKIKVGPRTLKATTLVLTETKKGWSTPEGSVHEFTLANPLSGLAIIDSIEVEVLEVVEDPWQSTEAVLDKYNYKVPLDPTFTGLKKFAGDFKYAPGEADRISALLTSKDGYDYLVRFIVTWNDTLKIAKNKTTSEIQVARFPSMQNPKNFNDPRKG